MKRIITIIGMMAIFILSTISFANTERDVVFEEILANSLKEMNLFSGVSDNNFALKRAPTRVEAIIMLIHLLGKDSVVLNGNWEHPFNDVPVWADKYIGYAYQNNLTSGVAKDRFGKGNANAATYLTFVLRALGYSDTDGKDFVWDNPFELAAKVGILPSIVNLDEFWRADVVTVSYAALNANMKGTNKTLSTKLMERGVFTRTQYNDNYYSDILKNIQNALTSQQIASKCSPAVFCIGVYAFNGEYLGNGSGFFISSNGLAVTNYHVVTNSQMLEIETQDGKTYFDINIIDADVNNDIALIKVNDGNNFPFLEIGDQNKLQKGQIIHSISYPNGEKAISHGIISNTNVMVDNNEYIQNTATIAPGSSGGALVDANGKVIGITSAGDVEYKGKINFARDIKLIDGLDKFSDSNLVLWENKFYKNSSNAYDFGEFSNVNLIDTVELPNGAIYKYDALDFYDMGSLSYEDSYSYTMEYYLQALLQNGFYLAEEIEGVYWKLESDIEIICIEVDAVNEDAIFITYEKK